MPAKNKQDGAIVHAEFTQDMEGQFLLELSYERLMKDLDGDLKVPTIRVLGAEVEQGRIAVEATSAMEVVATSAEQLTPDELTQLPHRLVGLASKPILMAYRYTHAKPAAPTIVSNACTPTNPLKLVSSRFPT